MKKRIPKILVVDDEKNITLFLSEILEDEGYISETAEDGEIALQKLLRDKFDVVLLDLKMPRMDGITLLKKINTLDIDPCVIILTGHGTIQDALLCTKLGAYDFIEKPVDVDKILVTLKNCLKEKKLLLENRILKGEEQKPVFKSKSMQNVKKLIEDNANSEAPVIIYAPVNSDKRVIARYIHRISKRKRGPFIFFDCSYTPQELIDKSLFDYSGNNENLLEGKFYQAHTGTLLIENIEHCPLKTQERILYYLTEGMVVRNNKSSGDLLDVRLIFDTSENLSLLAQEKKFHPKLLFAIEIIKINIPPLSTRKDDIPVLFLQFLNNLCEKDSLPVKTVSKDVFKLLKAYPWPGDVEELKNFTYKVYSLLSQKKTITLEDIRPIWFDYEQKNEFILQDKGSLKNLKLAKNEFEREYIRKVLEASHWDVPKAANILGIERTYLYSKIKKFNIHK